MHDRKIKKATEIRGKDLQPMQVMRKTTRISPKIRHVQDLLQESCTEGSDTRSSKGKLVVNDPSGGVEC